MGNGFRCHSFKECKRIAKEAADLLQFQVQESTKREVYYAAGSSKAKKKEL